MTPRKYPDSRTDCSASKAVGAVSQHAAAADEAAGVVVAVGSRTRQAARCVRSGAPLRLDYTGLKKRLGGSPGRRRKLAKPASGPSRGNRRDFAEAGAIFPLELHRCAFAGPLLMAGQSFPVEVFAIRLALLPATKQNANPLESQSPHYRISRFALGALLLVISPGPGRGADGMRRPLMKVPATQSSRHRIRSCRKIANRQFATNVAGLLKSHCSCHRKERE